MIQPGRLLADLHRLRSFGATGTGVVRPSLSKADMEAREWLRQRMAEAGLDASIDGVGNVLGRSRNPGPALLLGSHSDTQPRGGWLDGALGVIYALEAARALGENAETRHLAADVVAWVDEEGTFLGCLGSQSYVGTLKDSDVAVARDADGLALSDAMAQAGVTALPRARLDPERERGYLEAHIEQGPFLEERGQRIGVVTTIVGIRGAIIRFEGEQNHAGTTPMDRRKDAGMALYRFATALDERFAEHRGPNTVWTMGRAVLDPGAPSIIPGSGELTLQFRDPDEARLEALEAQVQSLAEEANARGPVAVTVERSRDPIVPTVMDGGFRDDIARAAEALVPGQWAAMPSAAGHDPMVLSAHLPCAMLFIPSINGVSHDFAEDTAEADIVTGAEVFALAARNALERLAG